jgi:hypothetical protein
VKRLFGAFAAASIVFAVAFASASSLSVSGGAIQAGVDASLWCDNTGVFVTGWGLETDDGLVSFVRIGGIEGACVGNDLFANITGVGGVELTEAGPVTISGVTETLTFDTPVAAGLIEDLHLFIEGPNGI